MIERSLPHSGEHMRGLNSYVGKDVKADLASNGVCQSIVREFFLQSSDESWPAEYSLS